MKGQAILPGGVHLLDPNGYAGRLYQKTIEHARSEAEGYLVIELPSPNTDDSDNNDFYLLSCGRNSR